MKKAANCLYYLKNKGVFPFCNSIEVSEPGNSSVSMSLKEIKKVAQKVELDRLTHLFSEKVVVTQPKKKKMSAPSVSVELCFNMY